MAANPKPAKATPKRSPRPRAKPYPQTAGVSAGVAAWSVGVALVGLGAAVAGVLLRRKPVPPRPQAEAGGDSAQPAGVAQPPLVAPAVMAKGPANPAEHAAPDLAPDQPAPDAQTRAPDAFRPDPTAPVPPELRESLRPATGPAPGFAADRGTTVAGA